MKLVHAVLLPLLLVACGGGGGGSGDDEHPNPPPPANPDIALLFVSGHTNPSFVPDGLPSTSYLDDAGDVGPAMTADLEQAGFTVETFYFVDHETPTDAPGYIQLVERLAWIRDNWAFVPGHPTAVVVVSHSHGGVWATAAIRAVPDVPVSAHIALDHCSYGWFTVGHSAANGLIGGEPRDSYQIGTLVSYPDFPGVPSDLGDMYDLEDVVMPSVTTALEVRSGEHVGEKYVGELFELFDEKWNVRVDGTVDGLSGYFSDTDHTEVHRSTGSTYPIVMSWLLGKL